MRTSHFPGWLTCRSVFARTMADNSATGVTAVGIDGAVPINASNIIARIYHFINYRTLDLSAIGDRHGFWFLQDVMSISLLVALLAQSMTLVER